MPPQPVGLLERLSAKHSGGVGSRSLDLLHVAAALEAGWTVLASFDDRQRKLAALAGLKLIPAKPRDSVCRLAPTSMRVPRTSASFAAMGSVAPASSRGECPPP
jgi:hypothetical protein